MATSRPNVSERCSQTCLSNDVQRGCGTAHTSIARDGLLSRLMQYSLMVVVAATSLSFSGCCSVRSGGSGGGFNLIDSIMQNQVACLRDKVWARRAFHLRYGHCERIHADHFRDGFVAGYCDICEGGNGECPAMPPEKYWGFQYKNRQGVEMQNAWFAGFEAGSGAANSDGAGDYQNIQISRQLQQAMMGGGSQMGYTSENSWESKLLGTALEEPPQGTPPMLTPDSNAPVSLAPSTSGNTPRPESFVPVMPAGSTNIN